MKLRLISENIEYTPKDDAHFGDCSLEVYNVSKRAMNKGVTDFIVVDGMVTLDGDDSHPMPHTWIEYQGKIIDPTVSQFKQSQINYNPTDEFRDERSGPEFVEDFETEYGDIL